MPAPIVFPIAGPVPGRSLELHVGDITSIAVDAIVNAANSALAGGGGVDGAIHRAGGPALMQELDEIRARTGGCPTGSAVVTGAGRLPARFVFHAVGPRYRDGRHGEPEQLASCYTACLQLARKHNLTSISFPSISTGIYGYPIEQAAPVAIRAAIAELADPASTLVRVLLVQFGESDRHVYREAAARLLAGAA